MFWQKVSSKNKAVLVTGCDSGFGNRLAYRLNSLGFRVYACVLDITCPGAQELATKCQYISEMCIIEMNVTNDKHIQRCYDTVVSDLKTSGRILWSVVNNAGVLTYGPLEWGSFDEYNRVFDVNVFGVVRVTRKFAQLIRQSRGRFVITASLGGRLAMDNLGVYCMSKYAIIAFADVFRREMSKFKVSVSTIEPMLFKTSMYDLVKPSLDNNWQQTDQDTQQAYGQQYYDDQHKLINFLLKIGMGNRKLDLVVNDMLHAIRARHPSRSYKPVNRWMFAILPPLLPLTPQWLIDWVLGIVNRPKPAFMISHQDKVSK